MAVRCLDKGGEISVLAKAAIFRSNRIAYPFVTITMKHYTDMSYYVVTTDSNRFFTILVMK